MFIVFALSLLGVGAVILVVAYATKLTLNTWWNPINWDDIDEDVEMTDLMIVFEEEES